LAGSREYTDKPFKMSLEGMKGGSFPVPLAAKEKGRFPAEAAARGPEAAALRVK
jgi:hypothetical protein